jgi:3-oxoadipate enol-lactonase/4-carboxymuconolactone decarboxylase
VPFVQLPGSPLAPDLRPIELYYRDIRRDVRPDADAGATPVLVLHGGWGYAFYPFDAAIAALPDRRVVIPDRTGYGRSPRITALPPRFHHAAAAEHEALLDALGIERCAIWGHSDGAVIATLMALRRPARVAAIVLEALHVDRAKPRSRAFFEMMRDDPDGFGPQVAARLAADHGEDQWRAVLGAGGRAWLDIAATPGDDLYDGRLAELAVPALVVHGDDDPRTEPGEIDRFARAVPSATIAWIAGGGHAPHSRSATSAETAAVAARFLRAW